MPPKKKKRQRNKTGRTTLINRAQESQPQPPDSRLLEDGSGARGVFQLNPDDPLPPVNEQSLLKYYHYFKERLPLPFPVSIDDDGERALGIAAELVAPEESDDEELQCIVLTEGQALQMLLAEVEPVGKPVRQAIQDYRDWLEQLLEGEFEEESLTPGQTLVRSFGAILLKGTVLGMLFGCLLMTVEHSAVSAMIGAASFGALMLLISVVADWSKQIRLHWVLNIISNLGVAVYASMLGGLAGALLVAYEGALPGAATGLCLGWLLSEDDSWFRLVKASVHGAGVGGVVFAYLRNADLAVTGVWQGAAIGALGGLVAMVALGGMAMLLAMSFKSQLPRS